MKSTEIKRLLPGVFQRTLSTDNPMDILLRIMEGFHEKAEDILDNMDRIFDPRRTEYGFLSFLSHWVNLDRILGSSHFSYAVPPRNRIISSGSGRLRELIATSVALSRWRGTKKGLIFFLEVATGISGFEIDEAAKSEDGGTRPFHLHILAPAEAKEHGVLIERIIEQEKPAYVTHELIFRH